MRADDITDVTSEAGVIASLVYHPEFSFYSENLLPNHFSNKENRYLYLAIFNMARRDINHVDAYSIIESLKSDESTRRYADELSLQAIEDFIENSDVIARHTVEAYKMCVDNVMAAAFKRDAFQALKRCESLCFSESSEDIRQHIYGTLDDVMSVYSDAEDVPEFKDIVDDLWAEIEAHQDGSTVGLPFKFPTLNEYLTIEPGELVVLGAPAKGAKSMFMLNEAVDLLRQGKSVMYIDSELSSRMFMCRLISHLTGIEFRRVKSGQYTEEERNLIMAQMSWIKQQKFVHVYFPVFNQETIYTAVKKVDHRFGKLDCLIVDYLKATGNSFEAYATYSELGKLTDLVKNDIAGKMNIATLAAAQLTTSMRLADSAKIERNASSILFLVDKTQEEMSEDGTECGNKKLVVSRNRNGMQHVEGEYIDVNFDGNVCLLTEAKQHIPQTPY